TGQRDDELDIKDLTWINASGAEMKSDEWSDAGMRSFGMLIDGRAQPTGIKKRGEEATMLLVFNAHHEVVRFVLPECAGGDGWTLLVDTNLPDRDDGAQFRPGGTYDVTARSFLLFTRAATRVS